MKKILLSTFFAFHLLLGYSQGCSDAGFCTLNTIKAQGLDLDGMETHRHQVTFGISYGSGQNDVNVTVPYAEYIYRIKDYLDLGAKLTYSFNNGELGNVSGFGDLFLSSNYRINGDSKVVNSFTLGFKIPLSDGNKMSQGSSLPMVYQPSLGTFDLIAGYNIAIRHLGIGVAYQQPLTNPNDNQFSPADFPDPRAGDYLATRSLTRKADVLLRVSYSIPLLENKLNIRPGLLPIYHLGNDLFLDENDMEQEIEGSQGLTLNGNIFVDYNINETNTIALNWGRPFISRDAFPDGLLRRFVVGVDYKVRF